MTSASEPPAPPDGAGESADAPPGYLAAPPPPFPPGYDFRLLPPPTGPAYAALPARSVPLDPVAVPNTPPGARPWALGEVLLTFAFWLLASIVAGAALLALPKTPAGNAATILLALTVQWVPLIVWPWWFARRRGAGPVSDFAWRIKWIDLPIGLAGGFVAILLGGLVASVTTAIFGRFSSAAGDAANQLHTQRSWLVVFAVLVTFGAPVVEEFTFRGVVFAGLVRKGLTPRRAAIVSAAAFAIFHFEPIRLGVLFTIGLVLGVLRERTGRVGAGIVAHSVNNALGALSLFIS